MKAAVRVPAFLKRWTDIIRVYVRTSPQVMVCLELPLNLITHRRSPSFNPIPLLLSPARRPFPQDEPPADDQLAVAQDLRLDARLAVVPQFGGPGDVILPKRPERLARAGTRGGGRWFQSLGSSLTVHDTAPSDRAGPTRAARPAAGRWRRSETAHARDTGSEGLRCVAPRPRPSRRPQYGQFNGSGSRARLIRYRYRGRAGHDTAIARRWSGPTHTFVSQAIALSATYTERSQTSMGQGSRTSAVTIHIRSKVTPCRPFAADNSARQSSAIPAILWRLK